MSTVWLEKDFGGCWLLGAGMRKKRAVTGFWVAKSEQDGTERKLRKVCLMGKCGLFEVCLGVYIGEYMGGVGVYIGGVRRVQRRVEMRLAGRQ